MRVRTPLLLVAAVAAAITTASPAFARGAETPPSTSSSTTTSSSTPTPPPTSPRTVTPRIVGGTPVPSGQLGFAASVVVDLGRGAFDFCGGTVVDRSWVMTAGHCVLDLTSNTPYATSKFTVRTSSLSWNSGGIVHRVDALRRLPMNPALLDQDIALLHLTTPARATPVKLIGTTAAEQALDDPGVAATAAGWGYTKSPNPGTEGPDQTLSDQLRQVTIPILDDATCTAAYPNDPSSATYPGHYIASNMLCAGDRGKDACFGDSGGPLLATGAGVSGMRQVGIVSWGPNGCAVSGFPGVYTRLSKFAPWAQATIRYGPFVDASSFVNGTFKDFTNRAPTSAELASWLSQLKSQAPEALLWSLSHSNTWDLQGGAVLRLYRVWFGMYPSTASMSGWLQRRRAGLYLAPMSALFAANAKAKARYPASLTNLQFINKVYLDVMGHPGTPAHVATWKKRLDGGLARSDMMVTFAQSAELRSSSAPQVWISGTWFATVRRTPISSELAAHAGQSETQILTFLRNSVSYAAAH